MSIIIGLSVTNLLAGAGRAFYRRNENPLDEVHTVLTVATLLLLALQWWVTFKWNTEINWSFDKFLMLIVWTITLYMLTVFLYPPDLSEAEEHQGRFERNRAGYILRSLQCVCSTSRKPPFTAISFIRFATFPSSVNTRCWLGLDLLPTGGATTAFSRGTN